MLIKLCVCHNDAIQATSLELEAFFIILHVLYISEYFIVILSLIATDIIAHIDWTFQRICRHI